jgi:hypothetical protein
MRLKMIPVIIVFLTFSVCVSSVYGQDLVTRAEIDQMKEEIEQLRAVVEDFKTVINHQNETIKVLKKNRTPLKTDEHGGAVAASSGEHEISSSPEPKNGFDLHTVLDSIKPTVSLTGDFVANLSDDEHIRTEQDRFDLRGVDISFTGEIDDVARAVFNVAYHDDDIVLEEGYLDVFDFLPFKTDFKIGKFRADFGLLNTVHPHALPQVDYPAVYREYLGHEGYIDEGIGIAGELPSMWGTPVQYSLQAFNGKRHEHGDEDHGHMDADDNEYDRLKDYDDIVYVGRLQNSVHLTEKFRLKLGFSGLTGKFEDDSESPRFYYQGCDVTFHWQPFQDEHNRIRWQTEFIQAQIEDGPSWERSYGLYSFLDYSFTSKWLAGVRYDYAEVPLHSSDHIIEYSTYLTHDYTENNRMRLQFKRTNRNQSKDTNEIFLQWIFTLGRHEHPDGEDH